MRWRRFQTTSRIPVQGGHGAMLGLPWSPWPPLSSSQLHSHGVKPDAVRVSAPCVTKLGFTSYSGPWEQLSSGHQP